jgi:hypothetical protein
LYLYQRGVLTGGEVGGLKGVLLQPRRKRMPGYSEQKERKQYKGILEDEPDVTFLQVPERV